MESSNIWLPGDTNATGFRRFEQVAEGRRHDRRLRVPVPKRRDGVLHRLLRLRDAGALVEPDLLSDARTDGGRSRGLDPWRENVRRSLNMDRGQWHALGQG